jgi:hypothetical protein
MFPLFFLLAFHVHVRARVPYEVARHCLSLRDAATVRLGTALSPVPPPPLVNRQVSFLSVNLTRYHRDLYDAHVRVVFNDSLEAENMIVETSAKRSLQKIVEHIAFLRTYERDQSFCFPGFPPS